MEKNTLDQHQESQDQPRDADPAPADDTGSVQIDAFLRIFDPSSKEVYLETRA